MSLVDTIITHALTAIKEELSITAGWENGSRIDEGRMQFDPTVDEINVLVNVGGSDDPHELVDDGTTYGGIKVHTYETGGGQHMMRRFVAELKLYMNEDDGEAARRKANEVETRCIRAIRAIPVGDEDEFGETSLVVQYRKSHIDPAGGEGMYIWTGNIKFEVLTYLD